MSAKDARTHELAQAGGLLNCERRQEEDGAQVSAAKERRCRQLGITWICIYICVLDDGLMEGGGVNIANRAKYAQNGEEEA